MPLVCTNREHNNRFRYSKKHPNLFNNSMIHNFSLRHSSCIRKECKKKQRIELNQKNSQLYG